MMPDKICPLGEDCDLHLAWMAGASKQKARTEAAEAEVNRLRKEMAEGSFYKESDIDALMNERDALCAEVDRLRQAVDRQMTLATGTRHRTAETRSVVFALTAVMAAFDSGRCEQTATERETRKS